MSDAAEKANLSKNFTDTEKQVYRDLADAFARSQLPLQVRLQSFPRHVRRQDIARFLVRYELFKLSLPANGSVVECGVFAGGGLMSWMHFSTILEPYNYTRKIIGFDSFAGFPSVSERDSKGASEFLHAGALQTHETVAEELAHLAMLHDQNRPLSHIQKVDLVKGDACETIPKYVEDHPHLLISLLYLDFDIYEPTKAALRHLYSRVVKGGIVAFDELNSPDFPGETTALLELPEVPQLRRSPFDPWISYFVKE